MVSIFFHFLKKFILAAVFIYFFDIFFESFYIPINFFTVVLVSLFDIPAIGCLILFSKFL